LFDYLLITDDWNRTMTDAFVFLIDTLFNLYLMVVLLRLWLQSTRADFL